jgi:hypothetical protein
VSLNIELTHLFTCYLRLQTPSLNNTSLLFFQVSQAHSCGVCVDAVHVHERHELQHARPVTSPSHPPVQLRPSAHSQEEQSKLPCKPASLLCPAARNRRRHGSTDLINSKPSERRRGSIRGMLEITNCNLHSGSNRRSDRTQQYVVPHEHVHTLPYACTCAVQPRPSASVCRPFNIHMQASARRRCSASPTD